MSTRSDQRKDAAEHGLYDPAYEHDACGVGFVASVKGQASHEIVTQALQILKNLDHRGAEEGIRNLNQNTGAVAAQRISTDRAAMIKIF